MRFDAFYLHNYRKEIHYESSCFFLHNLKNVSLLWAVWVFLIRVLPCAFLFLRVDCECNRPSCLATVFGSAYSFNGDLNQWDVAKVTDMNSSKSIRIVENDLT